VNKTRTSGQLQAKSQPLQEDRKQELERKLERTSKTAPCKAIRSQRASSVKRISIHEESEDAREDKEGPVDYFQAPVSQMMPLSTVHFVQRHVHCITYVRSMYVCMYELSAAAAAGNKAWTAVSRRGRGDWRACCLWRG